jgi:hypothetical protein
MDKPDVDTLKCQVAGCNANWTVSAGWKKCSKHAWSEEENSAPKIRTSFFDRPPVRPFTEVDDYEIF